MEKQTQILVEEFMQQQADLNGVKFNGAGALSFNIEPVVAQKLEKKVQESSSFLQRVQVITVKNQKGEKIGLTAGRPVTSTTDTSSGTERKSKNPLALSNTGYLCEQIDSDIELPYSLLDAWRHFSDFQIKWRDVMVEQIARDRLMIGFNGTHRAPTSDIDANPLLQDVATGWLQKIRNEAPKQVVGLDFSDPKNPKPKPVKIGKSGDYKNLDAMVESAVSNLLDPVYQNDSEVVILISRKLLANKYVGILNDAARAVVKLQQMYCLLIAI